MTKFQYRKDGKIMTQEEMDKLEFDESGMIAEETPYVSVLSGEELQKKIDETKSKE